VIKQTDTHDATADNYDPSLVFQCFPRLPLD
jgi:hypothetical protein